MGNYNNGWNRNNSSYDDTRSTGSYFHPSMLKDPWEELERELGYQKRDITDHSDWDESLLRDSKIDKELSDSLIPQVGDTLCERNEALGKSDESQDTPDLTNEIKDAADEATGNSIEEKDIGEAVGNILNVSNAVNE